MYGKGTAIAVYCGSYTCKDVANSFVYISGGRVKTHVFGSGYFGDMVKENNAGGNCYVYIGKNAVKNAPHAAESQERNVAEDISKLNIWIEGNVYAGANWGTYDPKKGFGASTIAGISNIYIDGEGYNMKHGKKDNQG